MTANLKTTRTTELAQPLMVDTRLATLYREAERSHSELSGETQSARRKLRKRVLIGNAVAWVVIIVAARLIFFS
ncbi:MAG: hypothetical protein ABWY82_00495 [Tardiphaga sp.]